MELRQLKYFLAVADSQSFLSAANNLYLSRQAVSKAVAQLETELNVELFVRDSGGAYLTPAGIMFYERVRNIVLELEELHAEMLQQGAQFRQVIRVAFSIGTLSLYEPRIQDFIRGQSSVMVEYWECTPAECETQLKEHKADLLISSTPLDTNTYQAQLVHASPYGLLIREGEALDEFDSIEAVDLQWLPLACLADGQSEAFCTAFGKPPMYKGVDLYRLFSIAADGQCATLLPECLFPRQFPAVRWVPLDTEQKWQVFSIYLKSAEKNTLFHSVLDEFITEIFDT